MSVSLTQFMLEELSMNRIRAIQLDLLGVMSLHICAFALHPRLLGGP